MHASPPSRSGPPASPRDLPWWVFGLVAAAFVGLSVHSAFLFPIFEGPDECWHFEYIRLLAQGSGLPVQDDPARRVPTQGYNPPAAYVIPAALLAWLDPEPGSGIVRLPAGLWVGQPSRDRMIERAARSDTLPPINPRFFEFGEGDEPNLFRHPPGGPWAGPLRRLHWLRVSTAGWGLLTLVAVFGLARLALPGRPAGQLVALALAAFNPKFIHHCSLFSNDALVTACSSFSIWLIAAILIGRDRGLGTVLALGVALGLGLLAKPTVAFLAGPALVVLYWRRESIVEFAGKAVWLGTMAAALAAWFYIRNAILYGNLDFMGLGRRAVEESMFLVPADQRWGFFSREFFPMLLQTYWDRFGWGAVKLPPWQIVLYCAMTAGIVLSLGGLAPGRSAPAARSIVVLLWCILLLNLASVVWLALRFVGNQGRYLYPSISALAVLGAMAFEILFESYLPRTRKALAGTLALAMALLVVYAQLFVIGPVYD